jgi:hypothetical protein
LKTGEKPWEKYKVWKISCNGHGSLEQQSSTFPLVN